MAAAEPAPGISPLTLGVFTVVGAIAVANVYYVQPILELMSRDLRVDARTIGFVSTALQIGYALGVLVFVPLGDIVQRRPLAVGMFAAAAVALALVSVAPDVALVALGIGVVGLFTTAAQLLIPFAADLAHPNERGRVLGTIQAGLTVGTLFARAIGGVLGAHFGWRAVFVFAATVSALSTGALARVLPLRDPSATLRYRDLIASMPAMIARHGSLRVSMALGMLSFFTFTGIWTVIAFHLHVLGYGSDIAGYVGTVSIAGAIAGGFFGALADRRGTLVGGTIGWLLTVSALAVFLVPGAHSIWGVIAGATLFSLGTQMTQISNQTRNFALADDARSRINTIYMFFNFLGGAAGSFVAAAVWQAGGWQAVCVTLLGAMAVMGLVLVVYARRA